jgi:heptosyltransferase I
LSENGETVGVLRLSALGDAVLILPMLNALICSGKFSSVTWVTTQDVADLVGPIKGCQFIVVEKIKSFSTAIRNWKKLRHTNFDKLILAQASFSAHAISLMLHAKLKVGFDNRRGKDLHRVFVDRQIPYANQHFVDAYYSFAREIGLVGNAESPDYSLAFGHLDKAWAKNFRSSDVPLVAIHPHPSKIERRWTADGYRSLIAHLLGIGIKVLIVGGHDPLEEKLNEELTTDLNADAVNLTGNLTLVQWASILAEVDLLIAPDTGAVHLANALGTKVVGLYAVANPELTGPHQNLQFCVNKYPEACKQFSETEPIDFHHRLHDSGAMELIEVSEVQNKVQEALASPIT